MHHGLSESRHSQAENLYSICSVARTYLGSAHANRRGEGEGKGQWVTSRSEEGIDGSVIGTVAIKITPYKEEGLEEYKGKSACSPAYFNRDQNSHD